MPPGSGLEPLCEYFLICAVGGIRSAWLLCGLNVIITEALSTGLALVDAQSAATLHLDDFALVLLVPLKPGSAGACLFFPPPASFLSLSIPTWPECVSSELFI